MMGMFASSMTEAQAAALQDELPTNLKFLTPLLESIRQAYEAAAPPPMRPVKATKLEYLRFTATDFTFRFVKQQNLKTPLWLLKC
jgi:hypothetical protein